MEKKKNDRWYIIPASHFKSGTPSEQKLTASTAAVLIAENKSIANIEIKESIVAEPSPAELIQPALKLEKRKASALSLVNIDNNRNSIIKKTEYIDENLMPKDAFTSNQLMDCWTAFSNKQLAAGKKLRSAVLTTAEPVLEGTVIIYKLPSALLKEQFNAIAPHLLQFLKEKLNNYSITFEVIMEESTQKKYAYSTHEKYDLLVTTNQDIAVLKETFKLEL